MFQSKPTIFLQLTSQKKIKKWKKKELLFQPFSIITNCHVLKIFKFHQLRWIHLNENHNFKENFEKKLFSKIYIRMHPHCPKLQNLNIGFTLIKNWLSICCMFFWNLLLEKPEKNLWKFFSNTARNLSLELELFLYVFSVHIHFFPPQLPMASVSMLKCTKWTLKSFKTKLNH